MHQRRPLVQPLRDVRAYERAVTRRVHGSGGRPFHLREALTAANSVLGHVGDEYHAPHLVIMNEVGKYAADVLLTIPPADVFLFQAEPERYLSQRAGRTPVRTEAYALDRHMAEG